MVVFLSQLIRGLRRIVWPSASDRSDRPDRTEAGDAGRRTGARASRPSPPRRGPAIQSLESRTLYAAHPGLIVGEQLLGPSDAITGVVLKVNQHLDPATASNPLAYQVYRRVISTDSGSDGFFGFGGSDPSTSVSRFGVRFASAVYDDASMTVTLTPVNPFAAQKFFIFVYAHGRGPNRLLTAQGDPISGNGRTPGTNAIVAFHLIPRKVFTYPDADGDRVTLKLTGPGLLHIFAHRASAKDPILTITGGNPVQTVLSGTVKKGRRGDGIANIQEIDGVTQVQDQLSTNSSFNVEFTQP